MPPEKDWRAPPDEAGDDALQYSDIAIGYLSRNVRYRSDYRRALGRVMSSGGPNSSPVHTNHDPSRPGRTRDPPH